MQYFRSGMSKRIIYCKKRASYTYFLILPWGEEKKKKDTSTGNWRRVSPLGSYSSCASGTLPWEICHHPIGENTQRTSLRNMPPTYLRNTRACLIWEICHRPNWETHEHLMYHLRDMPPLYQKKCTHSERDITPPYWKEYTITLFGEFVTSEKYITTRSKRTTTHSKRYVATLSKRNTYSTPYPKNTPPSYLKYMPPPYQKIH